MKLCSIAKLALQEIRIRWHSSLVRYPFSNYKEPLQISKLISESYLVFFNEINHKMK